MEIHVVTLSSPHEQLARGLRDAGLDVKIQSAVAPTDLWARLREVEMLARTNVLVLIFESQMAGLQDTVEKFEGSSEATWTNKVLV